MDREEEAVFLHALASAGVTNLDQAAKINGRLRYRFGIGFRPTPEQVHQLACEITGKQPDPEPQPGQAHRVITAPPEYRAAHRAALPPVPDFLGGDPFAGDASAAVRCVLGEVPPGEWAPWRMAAEAVRAQFPEITMPAMNDAVRALYASGRLERQSGGAGLKVRLPASIPAEEGADLVQGPGSGFSLVLAPRSGIFSKRGTIASKPGSAAPSLPVCGIRISSPGHRRVPRKLWPAIKRESSLSPA